MSPLSVFHSTQSRIVRPKILDENRRTEKKQQTEDKLAFFVDMYRCVVFFLFRKIKETLSNEWRKKELGERDRVEWKKRMNENLEKDGNKWSNRSQ